MYYIYHITGKKIGVTRDLNERVTKQQGYALGEYEVLHTSDDINEISALEIELQKSYGYKVDRQSYKNLINKNKSMRINTTEQTSTFPCPLNKLKGQLMDNLDLRWETSHGTFKITKDSIAWILKNARTSMFNDDRCYIYNKAYASEFLEIAGIIKEVLNLASTPSRTGLSKKKKKKTNIYDLIRAWAADKGIYESGDSKTQYLKLMEESGELAQALLKNDETEVIDAIGDMVVVLTNLAKLRGHNIEDCIASSYSVIKDRQGKMINGTFVKNTPSIIPSTVPKRAYLTNSTYPQATTTSNKFNNFSTNTL